MPIFIPDLFTGYINGRRAAIQDNWKDAENYNSVMKGQLDNALAMQTMADSARRSNASANVADMNQTIAGARTDNELDLLMKQRANNLNALKAQLEAIQAQYNIDFTKSDEYKKLMLGQTQLAAAAGQLAQPTSTTATGQTTVNPNLVPQGTSSINPENSPKWNLLDAGTQNYVRNYLAGNPVESQTDLDAIIDQILERQAKPQKRAEIANAIGQLNTGVGNSVVTNPNATTATEVTNTWDE